MTSDSRFSVGQRVIVVDETRSRAEIGKYPIIDVGRNVFFIRDSFGKVAFSLVDGFEKTRPGDERRARQAFTPQDWELEQSDRDLDRQFQEAGVRFQDVRRYPITKLREILAILQPPR